MPQKLPKPCKNALCANTTLHKSGYCEEHRPKDLRKRDKRYYLGDWKSYAKAFLLVNRRCKCGAVSEEVDHIQAVEHGGDFWAAKNHQALCHSCHSRKTAKEMKFGRDKVYTYENIYKGERK